MNEFCSICVNARLVDDLTDDNDFSSFSVGNSSDSFRIMLCSGFGKPLRLEFEYYNSSLSRWELVGFYYPKFCPNCGRRIFEY